MNLICTKSGEIPIPQLSSKYRIWTKQAVNTNTQTANVTFTKIGIIGNFTKDDILIIRKNEERQFTPKELKNSVLCWEEELHEELPYIEDPHERIKDLEQRRQGLKELHCDLGGSPSGFWAKLIHRNQRKIERAFRSKTDLQKVFKEYPPNPVQELYRVNFDGPILVVDYNSMYAWAVANSKFPHPAKCSLDENSKKLETLLETNKIPKNGIFSCVLTPIKSKLKQINSINYWKQQAGDYFIPLNLTKSDTITTLLHPVELNFWKNYFTIKIEWGIYSYESVDHPLKNQALKLFEIKNQASKTETKSIIKKMLVAMHGQPSKDKIHMDSTVNSLSSTILAATKIELVKLMVDAQNFGAEIICTNIDGLHLGFKDDTQRQSYKHHLSSLKLMGNDMGQLKIEAEAEHGIWLGNNLYQLADKDYNILKMAGFPNSDNPRSHKRKYIVYKKDGTPQMYPFNALWNFEYGKKIKTELGVMRYKRQSPGKHSVHIEIAKTRNFRCALFNNWKNKLPKSNLPA